MEVKTKKNIGDRLFKMVDSDISFFDIEGIKIGVSGNNYVLVKYILRKNRTAGYRTEIYESDLKDYYDSPEEAAREAAKAALASFVLPTED